MKIRDGFVSNSSSSSFIVSVNGLHDDVIILSEEDQKKLVEFGFKYIHCYSVAHLDSIPYDKLKEISSETYDKEKHNALCYDVSCNQYEVIDFLLRADISFQAMIHYGHRCMFYEKGSNEVCVLENYGIQYMMYYWNNNKHQRGDFLDVLGENIEIERIDKERYLRDEC